MKTRTKNYCFAAIVLLFLLLYFAASFLAAKSCTPDSDYANIMLESRDILHGNFFRSGWILTGISFLLTDLPYFMVGILTAGFGVPGYTVGVALMQTAVVAVGALLLFRGREMWSWPAFLLYFSALAAPSGFWLATARAHTGSVTLCLLALYLLSDENAAHSRLKYAAAVVLIAAAASGDMVSVVEVSFPIAIVSAWLALLAYLRRGTPDKAQVKTASLAVGAILLGMLADKLYFAMPGAAAKNGFLGGQTFTSLDLIGKKLTDILRALLMMYHSDFEGNRVASLLSPIYALRAVLLLLGLVCVAIVCFRLLTGRKTDYISAVLSVGFVLLLIVLVMTSVYTELAASRYFGYAPVCLSVVAIRTVRQAVAEANHARLKRTLVVSSLLCAAILALGDVRQLPENRYPEVPQDKLLRTLEREGLTNGYADFWNASILTLKSEDSIRSRAIIKPGEAIAPFDWFCKEEWYRQYADFIILQDGNGFGLTEEALLAQFGAPQRTVTLDEYRIFIYDHDISPDLAPN